ncbi:MAG: thermonuclease family protein [Gammaproteobacteria bacterium]|nr:thermonuclease family protein [Gammaproteobacteria bacterium]
MRQLIASVLFLALTAPVLGQEEVQSAEYLGFKPIAALWGLATVRDGDGVLFGDVEVRLRGIAAPEDSQKNREPGGPESTENLRDIVEKHKTDRGQLMLCHLDGSVTRGRPVGVCFLKYPGGVGGKMRDIGRLQVEMGHARDCPRFSGGMYADAEKLAKENGQDLSAIYPLPNYCIK